MFKRAFSVVVTSLFSWAIVFSSVAAAEDQPATAQPAPGFEDPEGIPPRPPVQDIEPVYRGPSIDTLATIRNRGTLRVGVALSEPMVMHDAKGELVGYSVDLAGKLAEDMGVSLELVETSWSQIIPDLLGRQFDVIIAGLWVTPARTLVMNYSNATATEGIYLIANKTMTAAMKTEQDFNRPEVKIVVYGGSVQERIAKRLFPQATLVRVEGDDNHFAPVLDGKAHAVLVPTFAPQIILASAPDILSLPIEKPVSSTFAAMGMRKGDPDFLSYLNTWLAFQRDDGWLGDRTSYWATTTDWMK
jgi:polar amino acid transport system substrate-binding protein